MHFPDKNNMQTVQSIVPVSQPAISHSGRETLYTTFRITGILITVKCMHMYKFKLYGSLAANLEPRENHANIISFTRKEVI
jgi:hypothetical protein